MTTTQEALKMAIEALENIAFEYGNLLDGEQDYGLLPSETNEDIIIAYRVKRLCQEALEQQEQEPVAFKNEEYEFVGVMPTDKGDINMFYKIHPAKQLSDEDIQKIFNHTVTTTGVGINVKQFARAIEAKIRGE